LLLISKRKDNEKLSIIKIKEEKEKCKDDLDRSG
jgi:hypothetical protein